MKKILSLLVAVLALAASATAQAQIISVQYVTASSPQIGVNTAGVSSISGWNEDVNAASISNLLDSTGAGTGIGLSTVAPWGGVFNQAYAFTAGSTGDAALFHAGALSVNTSPVTFTLTGLNTADTYSLITYSMSNTGSRIQGNINVSATGSSTYYLINPSAASYSTYTQGLATTTGTAVTGDYFEFTGITGVTTLTFSLTNQGGAFADLPGFQLIQSAGAPEPSEVLLMGIGLVGLMFFVRRKRLASL